MSREKIDRLLEIGDEFWIITGAGNIIYLVFKDVRDLIRNKDLVVDIDIEIDDTDDSVEVMPLSVIQRRRNARPATEKELLAY